MTGYIFYGILWTAILLAWLRYSRLSKSHAELSLMLQLGFLLKVGVGCLFLYVYKNHYSYSDAYTFLEDSRILNGVFYSNPKAFFSFLTGIGNSPELIQSYLSETQLWSKGPATLFNDSANVIRFNSVLCFISNGNAHVHVIFMSLFSILGLRDLTIAFKNRINVNPNIIFAGLILIPNVLFWTSGILKEPFVILGMGILIRGLLADETQKKRMIRIIIGLLLLLCFKPYLLVCILLAAGFFAFSRFVLNQRPFLGLAAYTALLLGIIVCVPPLKNSLTSSLTIKQLDSYNVGKGGVYVIRDSVQFYYFRHSDREKLTIADSVAVLNEPAVAEQKWIYKRSNFEPVQLEPKGEKWKLYMILDSSQSLINTTPINHSFRQLMLNVPESLANALLRPFPTDPGSLFIYPAMVEVFLCMGLLLIAVFRHRKLSADEKRILIGLIIFSLALLLLIGWTSPVIGAIVRYRLPAYMAIFIISIFVIRIPQKWKRIQ